MLRRLKTQRKKVISIMTVSSKGRTFPIDALNIHFDDNYIRIALELREALGISIKEQYSWRDSSSALRAWKEAVEGLGIFVVQNDSSNERIPLDVFRGFVLNETPYPIIAINSSDASNGKIFTLMHELSHLIHMRALSNNRLGKNFRSTKYLEIMCNRVAAELLVPTDDINRNFNSFTHTNPGEINTVALKAISGRFSVSQEVILNRLSALGLITKPCYETRLEEIQQAALIAKTRPGGAPPPHVMAVAKNGRTMTGLVLNALAHKRINRSDASECLRVRIKHLKNISDFIVKATG
jgi:Zn-dependent peptidase ImmA (M78 family)